MTWKSVRLELAEMEGAPRGSPSRVYLLTVPLNDQAEIDAREVAKNPFRATFRRFWPSEPDEVGHVVQLNGAWLLRGDRTDDGEARIRLGSGAFRRGEKLEIAGPTGQRLAFFVAAIKPAGALQ
jgi:hypothetical protein